VAGIVVAWVMVGGAAVFRAQTPAPPVLLVLDQTAIPYGPAPLTMLPESVNALIKAVGLRDPLPYFASRTNESLTLPSGQDDNDGWFAIRTVPAMWSTESDSDDGLQNFWLAGPGLGSPDENGDRASRLTNVGGLVPLRAAGLALLTGRQVCAVVYDGDVTIGGTPPVAQLDGPSLGVVAFEVTSVESSSDRPAVTVKALNVRETCGGVLAPLAEAPGDGSGGTQ
jgi:hypothetical protein